MIQSQNKEFIMRTPSLTKNFVKQNPDEAWDIIRFKRGINTLTDYDFTPFSQDGTILNVKNTQKYILNKIQTYRFSANTNFVTFCNFTDVTHMCLAFFVLTPKQITKHSVKIKKIIANDILPCCFDEYSKMKVYHCLTDLKSIIIDYRLEQEDIKKL